MLLFRSLVSPTFRTVLQNRHPLLQFQLVRQLNLNQSFATTGKENKMFTKDHEWISLDDWKVGITHHAQESLGEVVFVELPPVGKKLVAGKSLGVVESVKATSDVYSPIDGEVVETNQLVAQNFSLLNSSPEKDGWLVRLKPTSSPPFSSDKLLSREQYEKYLEEHH